MGIVSDVFSSVGISSKADVKHQLFSHDNDNSLEFRKLKIEMSQMVEDREGKPWGGFLHKYKNEYWFPGYEGIEAGYITPGFERDAVLEIHKGIFEEKELPDYKDGKLDEGPISDIANNKCYELDSKIEVGYMSNKLINTLIIIDIGLLLLLAVKIVRAVF